jgi:hypothetical protein
LICINAAEDGPDVGRAWIGSDPALIAHRWCGRDDRETGVAAPSGAG